MIKTEAIQYFILVDLKFVWTKKKKKTIQLCAKFFMGSDFCHNDLHTRGWYKRLLSVYVYLNLKLYHSKCLKDVQS